MKMKNIRLTGSALLMLLTACLLLTLTACNAGDTEEPAEAPTADQAEATEVLPTDASTDAPTEASTAAPTDAPTEASTAAPTDAPTEAPTETQTEAPTEAPTEPETEGVNLNVEAQNLEDMMQSLFAGDTVRNETVMFLDGGEEKSLLYRIDEVLSVTSYDGKITYKEGIDYCVDDGKLVCLEGGSIPCITSETYWGADSTSYLMTKNPDGKAVYTYWGEASAMTKWQVSVTYTHSDTWEGFVQPCQAATLKPFLEKLKNGEDVTVIFYGDSITFGANASYIVGNQPGQMPYTVLFTKALADLFGYNVHFVKSSGTGTPGVPQDYDTGSQATITYINSSVGGWTSQNGVDNYDTYVRPYIEQYGCDLFLLAFGMNDASGAPRSVWRTQQKVLDNVIEQAPDVNLLVMATMVPNPEATNGWYGNQAKQEPVILKGAQEYTNNGTPCVCVQMTSASLAVLEHKSFRDYTGNNINHPNDFFSRVYAQTMLQCVVGYENMK